MSLLLNIPEDLCHELLSEWLTYSEWIFIDSAITNETRYYFLRQLKRLSLRCFALRSACFYNWLYERGIRMHNLIIRDNCFKGQKLKFNINLDVVDSISVHSRKRRHKKAIEKILLSCKSIQHFVTLNSDFLVFLNLSQLTCLDIEEFGGDEFTSEILRLISQYCHNLKELTLNVITNETYSNIFCDIIANNPQLVLINVCGIGDNDSFLFMILNCRKDIETISNNFRDFVDINHIAKAISTLPKLAYLYLFRFLYAKDDDNKITIEIDSCGWTWNELIILLNTTPVNSIAEITASSGVTREFIDALKNHCGQSLVSINFLGAEDLSTSVLLDLLQYCPLVTVIGFTVTDEENLLDIFQVYNNFREINIYMVNPCPIETVISMIRSCLSLESLLCNVMESEAIFDWKHLMYTYTLTYPIQFQCTLVFDMNKSLTYKRGKIKGCHDSKFLEKYLTLEEVENSECIED